MRSLISVSVANLVSQHVKDTPFCGITFNVNLCNRFVLDIFVISHPEHVEAFHNAPNNDHPIIGFTREAECDNTFNFLNVAAFTVGAQRLLYL